MNRKMMVLVVVLAMLPVTLLGCGQGDQPATVEEEVIKIGCVLSMSGALGAMGIKMADAVTMAVAEINAAGGINGKQIELIIEDDATDAVQALAAVRKLVEINDVQFMIAGMTSGAAKVIGPYLAERQVIAISPSATSPTLTGKPWRDYFFRTAPSDAFQGQAIAQLALDKGLKRLVVFAMNNPYGMGLGEAAQNALIAGGAEVIDFVKYDPAKLDYLTELTHIRGLNPDGIIHIGYNDCGRVVYRQALKLGLDDIQWIGADGVFGTGMLESEATAQFMATAVIGTRPAAPDGAKEHEEFKTNFKAKFNAKPEVFCDTAYDAMKLIAAALNKAGSTEVSAVRQALLDVAQKHPGASGTITFDEGGDRVSAVYEVWDVVEEGGEFKFVRIDTIALD